MADWEALLAMSFSIKGCWLWQWPAPRYAIEYKSGKQRQRTENSGKR
jgi:hypothetical protein